MATKKALAIKAADEQSRGFLDKIAGLSNNFVVTLLEHEFLTAQVGKKVFGGKGVIFDAGDKAVGIRIKFSDGFDYDFTIKRN